MKKTLSEFFFAPSSGRPLAVLRLTLGIFLFTESLLLFPSLSTLFGPHGYLDAALMAAMSGISLPLYAGKIEALGVPYGVFLEILFALRMVAILAFGFGYRTFLATFFLLLTQIFFMNSGALSVYGLDRYFHVFLFLLLFFPCGRTWSVDAKGENPVPDWRCTFGLRVLQMALLVTYFNAGFAKATGPDWWTGETIWRALNLPEFRHFDFLWMANVPWLPKVLGIGTVLLELLYFLGAWISYLGPVWTIAIIGMHLGIAAFMGLVNFGLGLAAINAALFLFPRSRFNS